MSQRELFQTTKVIHYGPIASVGQPNFRRVALCGLIYRVAGSIAEPPEPEGSSAIGNVTCADCLRIREERA